MIRPSPRLLPPPRLLPSLAAPLGLALALALAPVDLGHRPGKDEFFALASAAAAENVAIDKIEIKGTLGTATLTNIALTGSTLSKAEIEGLFKATSTIGLANRLEKLDAEKMTIDAIEWKMELKIQDSLTRYEGFEATDIKAGLIGRVVIKGAKQSGTTKIDGDKPQKSETIMGQIAAEKVDLAHITRLFSDADPTGKAPMKPLYGAYSIESVDVTTDQAKIHIGKTTASGARMRLLKKPLVEMFDVIAQAGTKKDDPDATKAMFALIEDAFLGMELGDGGVDGISVAGKDPKGKPVDFSIAKIAFSGGDKPSNTIADIKIKAEDGSFTIKRIAMDGSLAPMMFASLDTIFANLPPKAGPGKKAEIAKKPEPAKKAEDDDDDDEDDEEEEEKPAAKPATPVAAAPVAPAVPRAPLKDITFRLEGLDADVPDTSKTAKPGDRIKLSLAAFETTSGSFIGLMPTRTGFSLDHFVVTIPPNTQEAGLKDLLAAGHDKIDVSAKIFGNWVENNSTFKVDEISVDLDKMGKVTLKGEIGNVKRALFEQPRATWALAAMGFNLQNLTLAIENRGLAELALKRAAGEQNKSADQLKLEISTMGPAMIGMFMSDHPDAARLSEAVGTFLKTLGSLTLTLKAIAPAGITMMDLAAAEKNPPALLKKIKIEASAK